MTAPRSAASAPPKDVERIALAAALRVLNSDYGRPAIGSGTYQLLAASSVDALKAEVIGPVGHWLIALESAESRWGASERAYRSAGTGNLHLSGVIDHDFNGALTVAATAAYLGVSAVGHALLRLHAYRGERKQYSVCCFHSYSPHEQKGPHEGQQIHYHANSTPVLQKTAVSSNIVIHCQ
jgi:hypothetical protein